MSDRAEAVTRLVTEHGGQLYGIARKLCGHADDADDLVQETFLQAYRKWDQFEGRSKPMTWLYTIAARRCIRMRRRKSGEPERMASLEELAPFADGPMAAPDDGPLSEQIRQEGVGLVQNAIVDLPEDFRVPLVLKDVAGLSIADIAGILEVPAATVKTRVHRARLKIRKALEETMVKRDLPPAAYERQVCLDLLEAKQNALDHGVEFDQDVVCQRCRAVFASLDMGQELCMKLGEGSLPTEVRDRVLAAIAAE
jgi:RNA polymerase sigma-70 factor (ECF subfamily)